MSEPVEYHEKFCMTCRKYKSGKFYRVYRKDGRFAHLQCADCKEFRVNLEKKRKEGEV